MTGVNISLEAVSRGAHQFSLRLCSKVSRGGNGLHQIDFRRKWGLQNPSSSLVSVKAKGQVQNMTEDTVECPGFGGTCGQVWKERVGVEFRLRMGTNMGMRAEQIMTRGMP